MQIFIWEKTRLVGFLLLLVFINSISFAQRSKLSPPEIYTGSSTDGKFFAVNHSEKRYKAGEFVYYNTIRVYHVKSRKFISFLRFKASGKTESLTFSPDNKLLVLKSEKDFYLFDYRKMKLEKKFENISRLFVMENGEDVLVMEPGKVLNIYNRYNWNPDRQLTGHTHNDSFISFIESPDGNFLLGKTSKGFILWSLSGKPEMLGRIPGFDARFIKNGKEIVTLDYQNRLVFVKQYETLSLHKKTEFNCNAYKSYLYYDYKTGSSLSPDGELVAFLAKKLGETLSVGVFNIDSKKLIFELDSSQFTTELLEINQPYKWVGSQEMVLLQEDEEGTRISINSDADPEPLSFKHKFFASYSDSYGFQAAYVNKKVGFDQWRNGYNLVLKETRKSAKSFSYTDAMFLSFSADNQFVFIEQQDTTHALIKLRDLEKGQFSRPLKFSKTLFRPGRETAIVDDAKAPPGYEYTYLKNYKHIKDLPPDARLKVHYLSQEHEGKKVGVKVHLMDEEGNYYYGASEKDWEKIWCNLKLTNKKGKSIEKKFEVEEITSEAHPSQAIVIVMDHSGSMGNERAYIVQDAVDQFIENKREVDMVALVKYDSHVGTEAGFSTSKDTLMQQFNKNGLSGYGGGTALIDATYEGVEMLDKLEGYEEKSIIVFTDGNENSSVLTPNELVLEAREKGVKIHNIGFGDVVDERYLQKISTLTEGGYFQIYDRLDFMRIFDDVYKKNQSYYTVNFEVDGRDVYNSTLKICGENISDSINITFSNRPVMEDDPVEEIEEDEFNRKPNKGEVKLLNVKFEFANTNILEESKDEVRKAIAYMHKYPNITVELRGHTDDIGTAKDNLMLSTQRANRIKEILVSTGIKPERILIAGFGEDNPIATNDTEEGRALNRRTEFVVISQ
ncbi:VWA domain-containing protein [Flexithrix dorotheae]|uniref:VWA domain-containing protein n=1 Tax=Flexithrix dorotheae TaxID=70993 RepID=UPI000360D1A0|nr:VWA domain-containing protein [Flexithrix dorotheae]